MIRPNRRQPKLQQSHRRVRELWRKRAWRCLEPACAMVTSTEMHALAPPRALLTRRAVA
jgi:transposase ISL3 family protein